MDDKQLVEIIRNCDIDDAITIFQSFKQQCGRCDYGMYDNIELLHYIVGIGNVQVIKIILKYTTDDQLNTLDANGNTPIHYAIQHGKLDNAIILSEKMSYEQLLIKNKHGDTILHDAVKHFPECDVKVILAMLSNKQDTDDVRQDHFFVTNENGDTFFHLAVMERMVLNEFPIECFTIKNNQGNTPLHLASHIPSNDKVIEFILKNTSDEILYDKNNGGDTPLHVATLESCDTNVKILLEKMSNSQITSGNREGNTPLHLAVIYTYPLAGGFIDRSMGRDKIRYDARYNNTVNILMDKLTDDNLVITNNYRDTPLHLAAERGTIDVVKAILARILPEDRFIKNINGYTPLDVAKTEEKKALFIPCTKSANL